MNGVRPDDVLDGAVAPIDAAPAAAATRDEPSYADFLGEQV